MISTLRFIFVGVITSLAIGCGGGGGGGGTGTATTPIGGGGLPPPGWSLDPIVVSFNNIDPSPAFIGIATILQAQILLDGRVIGQANFSTATQSALLAVPTSTELGSGSHTLEFRITSQNKSPSKYEVVGMINATRLSPIAFQLVMVSDITPQFQGTLQTGQGIVHAFSLP